MIPPWFIGVARNGDSQPQAVVLPPYARTSFGEIRVAPAVTLFDAVATYELDPLEWGTSTAGGGSVAYQPTSGVTRVEVSSTAGDEAIIRTHTFFRYKAGSTLRVKHTLIHADLGQTNQVRRWGFFDDEDGLGFQLDGTTLSVFRRSSVSGSVVDQVVAQADWNGDRMNGTGQSADTLIITNGSIYEIDLQWLSLGTVRFWINGVLVHTMTFGNAITVPYMRTATLPLQVEVVNSGGLSTSSYVDYVCASVHSDGGSNPPEYTFGVGNTADVSIGVTESPILAIQPALIYAARTNRMLILPRKLSVRCEGGRASVGLILNPTSLTGGAFSSVDASSSVEFNPSASAFSGGIRLLGAFLPNASDGLVLDLKDFFTELGRKLRVDAFATAQDMLVVTGANESGAGTTNMRASLTWGEVR